MKCVFKTTLFLTFFCFASVTASAQTGIPNTAWYTANPAAAVFTISTADELAGLAQIVNGTWGGTPAKFDFGNRTVNLMSIPNNPDTIDLSAYPEWTPIGTSASNRFSGMFNGNGNIITGLYINDTANSYNGLFGYVSGSSSGVKNLVVENANIAGGDYTGTILGYISIGGISNCYVTGGSVTGKNYTGGVAGYVSAGSYGASNSVTDCYFSGEVSGNNSTGGVIGYVDGSTKGGQVLYCHSDGAVTGNNYAGGVAGYLYNSVMTGCYSTASVTGSGSVGGLVGRQMGGNNGNGGTISCSYFSGTVSGESDYIGGLVGYLSAGTLTNSYSAAASVAGANYTGGLVGSLTGGGTVENSAALDSSVTTSVTRGLVGRVVGAVSSGGGTLNNNLAWDSMYINKSPLTKGPNTVDGADISTSQIVSNGTIGGLFENTCDSLVTAPGKLPGLGAPVDPPDYLAPPVDLAALLSQIEAALFSTTQAVAPDSVAANAAVQAIIDSLGLNLAGIGVTVNDSAFTPAAAGTLFNPLGTDGSLQFTVTLTDSANGTQATSSPLTLDITATPYVMTLLEELANELASAPYLTTQAVVTDTASANAVVRAVIDSLIGQSLSLLGITATVNDSLFTPAIAGTLADPDGTDGSLQFTVTLSIGGYQVTTPLLNLDVKATPVDPLTVLVSQLEAAPFSTTQAIAPDSVAANAAVQAIIDSLGLNLAGIGVTVNDSAFTPAVAGTVANPLGTDGSLQFTVTLIDSANGNQATTSLLTLPIAATPVDPLAVLANQIETAPFSTTQAIAPDSVAAIAAVQAVIDSLGLNLAGIGVTVNDSAYTPAVAGTAANPLGTDGSLQFTVTLIDSANGNQVTTSLLTLPVTATPVDPLAVLANQIEAAPFLTTQTVAPDSAAAIAAVQAIINSLGLNLAGIGVTVNDSAFTPAVAGTVTNPLGTNGSLQFTVTLVDSANGNQVTTSLLTLPIAATPVDPLAVLAKQIEAAPFLTTQAIAPDSAAAIAAVQTIIDGLGLNLAGIGVTVNDSAFTPAVAGTVANPLGTNGSLQFTVTLVDSANGNQVTTSSLTLPIAATPVNPLTVLVNQIEAAPFLTTQAIAPDSVSANAAVQTIIDGLGLNLAGIGVVVNDSAFTPAVAGTAANPLGTNGSLQFTVTLVDSANGTQTTTSLQTLGIVAAPYTGNILQTLLNQIAAIPLIATQGVVTDITAARLTVESLINALGLNLAGISMTINDSSFTPAVAGTLLNPLGTNGNYIFTITLADSSSGAVLTSPPLDLTIVATPFGLIKRAEPTVAVTANVYGSEELTAGPNPVAKHSGSVTFFWQGKAVKNGTLSIYSSSGNLIKKINISDKSTGGSERRKVGSWDLKDSKGRAVSAGTYAVKGTVTGKDGKKEKVSLIVGVR